MVMALGIDDGGNISDRLRKAGSSPCLTTSSLLVKVSPEVFNGPEDDEEDEDEDELEDDRASEVEERRISLARLSAFTTSLL